MEIELWCLLNLYLSVIDCSYFECFLAHSCYQCKKYPVISTSFANAYIFESIQSLHYKPLKLIVRIDAA